MSEGQPKIFLSYARADGREHAERLYQDFTRQGYDAWRDERNLDPFQDFTVEIEVAIQRATHLVACLTPQSLSAEKYMRREIIYARLLGKPIIPVRFQDLIPPIQIVDLTWIDAFGRAWPTVLQELCARLALDVHSHPPAPPFADPFADYLRQLYQEVVDYLQATVVTLIPLHSSSTPGAVPATRHQTVPALLTHFSGALAKPSRETAQHFAHFADAFAHYRGRVLLLGAPGAGKTTTLMAFARDAIARRLSDPTQPLPVLGRIAMWDAVAAPELADWLDLAPGLAQLIREGRALLFLDGLDELGSIRTVETVNPETGKMKTEQFDPRQKFLEALPHENQIVMSTRVADYAEVGAKAALTGAVTLAPLSDAQMQSFLAEYPYLWETLKGDPTLQEVARTPLLLSIFTFAYAEMGDAARQMVDIARSPGELRAAIFQRYVECRWQHEASKPQASGYADLATLHRELGRIAADNAEDTHASENVLPVRAFAPALLAQAKLLALVTAIDAESVRFVHLLLRNHFAYPVLLERFETLEPQYTYTHEDSDLGYRVGLLAHALGRLQDDRAHDRLKKLADSNSSEGVRLVSAVDSELGNDFRMYRYAMLHGAIACASFEQLLAHLRDPDEEIRSAAATRLGQLNDRRALEPLNVVRTDPAEGVRASAERAIALLGTDFREE